MLNLMKRGVKLKMESNAVIKLFKGLQQQLENLLKIVLMSFG
jgi:hypothetical protein